MWLLLVVLLIVEVIGGSRRRESRLGDSGGLSAKGIARVKGEGRERRRMVLERVQIRRTWAERNTEKMRSL